MNAKQLKAIMDTIEEALSDVDIKISDELADNEIDVAFRAVRCLSFAVDRAFNNLYNMLSEEQQREYDRL